MSSGYNNWIEARYAFTKDHQYKITSTMIKPAQPSGEEWKLRRGVLVPVFPARQQMLIDSGTEQ